MIRCLSKEVQGKIRSGIAIFSLQQCVEELLLNSIDAGATCVGVRVDMDSYKVQVIDNGSGIGLEDMERIGNRYCTSKCSTLEDLDNLRFYGFRGEAVASIVTLARLVEISSRTRLSVKTHVKVFKDGRGLDVFEADTTRPSAGTSVTICSFFHNMPVRRKRMDAVLECERIRQRVEAISLVHPSVSFTLKNDCTGAMVVQLPKARNTYARFIQIHGLTRAQKLAEISYSHAQFKVTGYVGREGHYNNSLQFLYVNDRLLLKTRIQKLLNLILRKVSGSSNQRSGGSPLSSSTRSPKQQRRGAESYGVYVLNITCQHSEYDICLEPAKTLVEFRDWEGVLFCVEEAVRTFLTRENLVVELSPEDLADAGRRSGISGHGTVGASGDVDGSGRGENAPTEDIIAQRYGTGATLASAPVHRSIRIDGGAHERGVQACAGDEICGAEKDGERKESGAPPPPTAHQELGGTRGSASRSVDTDREAPQRDLITLPNKSVSVPHDGVSRAEEVHNVAPGEGVTSEEAQDVGASLATSTRSEVGHMNVNEAESADKESSVSLSRSGGVGLFCSVPHKQDTSCIEHKLPPRLKIRLPEQSIGGDGRICQLNSSVSQKPGIGGNERICQSNSSVSQKPSAPQCRLGLAVRSQKNPTAKRNFSFVESSGYAQVSGREHRDLIPAIPPKISKVISCQKLALSTGAGSLDNFRRIYGRPSGGKSLPMVTNSNHSTADAVVSSTNHSVTAAKSAPWAKEEKNECVVMELQTVGRDDHRSPLTLSVFASKLASRSAQQKGGRISLAAKLSHLKDLRLTSSAPEVPPSGETRPAEDTLATTAVQDVNNNEPACELSPDIDSTVEAAPPNPDSIPECSSSPRPPEEDGVAVSLSDWFHHYDDSVGKLVYVNKVTGLSQYEDPSVGEPQVSCTSDVTNMAISVISKQEDDTQTSNSLASLYLEWKNPVFERPPMVAVDISTGQAEGLAVKIHNILFPYRFSKDMIHSMKVIHQVDKKFLACLIDTRDQESANSSEARGNLLVLVDQHAAHERVRLEGLIEDSYEDDPDAPGARRLCSSTIAPPLEVSVTPEELRLLRLVPRPLTNQQTD